MLNEDINVLLFLVYKADYLQYCTDFYILNKIKKTCSFYLATDTSYHVGAKLFMIFTLTAGKSPEQPNLI